MNATNCTDLHPRGNPIDAEERLVALGWHDHVELSHAVKSFGLRRQDFRDRMCGVVVEYLRECADCGLLPTRNEAIDLLQRFNVLHLDEFDRILAENKLYAGDSLLDLAQQVQKDAADRAVEDAKFVTREALTITLHSIACPRCQQCAMQAVANGTRHLAHRRPGARGSKKRKSTIDRRTTYV